MIRIGFTGCPGSGKTSTARALAAFCRSIDSLKRVELIPEYARRYIAKYGPITSIADQYRIMEKQIQWEDSIPQEETDILISDSPIHMGWLYVMECYPLKNQKELMYSNDVFKRLNKLNLPPRYDIVFHLPPVIAPIKDGVRSELHFDEKWRESSNNRIKFIFNLFPPLKFIEITSVGLKERVEDCITHLSEHLS